MTTLPQMPVLDDIVAYPDDIDPNLYYLAKSVPQIRMDGDTPVFNGLFWTDKADGSNEATAGLAGGYINFDIDLAISEEEKKKAAQKIKSLGIQKERRRAILKLERERLGLIAKARGEKHAQDPDVPPVGEVVFGALQFTSGTVDLLEEKDGDLVKYSSAGGPASLVGDNNAAFALRLSHEGAAIWYNALRQGDKAISARYTLEFLMRLPSLEIRAWAGSTQKSEIQRKVDRVWKNVDKGCKDADVERIDVSSVVENLSEEGLVNIEIKKGSTEISDEHVSQLRTMAIKLIEEKVKEIIKSRIHGMTEEERKTSMIELMKEEISSFVELRFTQRDVVKWKMSPQATIMNFLEDVPEEKKRNITKLVDLSEDIVGTISIPIRVDAPWEEAPNVSTVKVTTRYPAADESASFLFKKGMEDKTWFFRRPENDDGIVSYSAEVYFKGVTEPLVIPTKETNGSINVVIGKLGMMEAKFKAHPTINSLTGDNRISAIEVALNYKSPDDPDHFTSTIVFTPEEAEGKTFKRAIYKTIDAPVDFQIKYFAKNDKVIDMPPKKIYFGENQIEEVTTENPYKDALDINVELGLSPDPSLKRVSVEFKYEDSQKDFTSEATTELLAEDDWEASKAKLVVLDKTKQDFKYRYKLTGDNLFAKSDWIALKGDTNLVLPIQKVIIDVSRLKLGTTYTNALLDMHYEHNDQKINQQFFLNATSGAQLIHWYIPRSNAMSDSFTYDLTLYTEIGEEIAKKGIEGRGNNIIVKPLNT